MTVFSKIRGFFSRHRNKFIVSSVLITGTILLTRYAQRKLKEWEERETKEFLERSRKQQHFESTETTCNKTILSLVSSLNEALSTEMNSEEIIKTLRSNPENKLELWDELKVMVFSRASVLIYLCVILVITLRIQLNILGGYLYKNASSVSQDIQEEYLLLCQNLMNHSLKRISNIVTEQYKEIIGTVDLKKQIGLSDLENTFWSIQTAVTISDKNPLNHLSTFVIIEEPAENGLCAEMIRDTADLLDSDEVKSLANHCINRAFSTLIDKLTEYFVTSQTDTTANGFIPPTNIKIPLAKLLPIINGLFARNLLPDILIQQLITNDKIKSLGANVYESFSYKNQ